MISKMWDGLFFLVAGIFYVRRYQYGNALYLFQKFGRYSKAGELTLLHIQIQSSSENLKKNIQWELNK